MSSSTRNSSTRNPSTTAATRTPHTAVPRPALLAAAALGLVAVVLATWLSTHPTSLLGRDPEVFLVRVLLGPRATAVVLGALGLAGTLGALLALGARTRPQQHPGLLVLALVEVAGCGVALQSVTTIALAGYLLAMALPLGVVVLAALVVRRYRRVRWAVLAVVGAGAARAALSWPAVTATLAGLVHALSAGAVASSPKLAVTLLTGGVVGVWVLVAVRLARGAGVGRAGRSWVLRHRRALTLVAAAGPLPYGLARLTWLTPWPLVAPDEVLSPELRLWGLLLGGAALLGTVLTLGLVLPWGERFPRWFPGLAGRPVPVAAAVAPGGLVAGLVWAAAVPMLRLVLLPAADEVSAGLTLLERLGLTLVFPFWLWGPTLALAVWGYALHRSASIGPDARRG